MAQALNLDPAVLSVNHLSAPLVRRLLADAAALRLGVDRIPAGGAVLIDAGIRHQGGLEAGRRIAEICLAGLGTVRLTATGPFTAWPWQVEVATSHPVLACLASQYAGWSLGTDEPKFQALGSGPGRALAGREPLFETLGYRDRATSACLVLETDRFPPLALIDKICRDCGIDREALTLILTPTGSLAGVVQIAARVVEVALHKAHELQFPLERIVDALGSTPIPPPHPDGLQAMGRTNDTILFGGQVQLFVTGPDDEARQLAEQLPSSASRDYGRPFAEVFKAYDYDFFKLDPMLFSPARVIVTALDSGRSFRAGNRDEALLARSFDNT
ncbi:MAG: methenyltetrahydromethanopterin cyclohydrolase [Candidatus Competibacterales bacterium]|nr:methenyltetrahydromethanopterin cyclohydrolase [Candidatus Competibacterales bacterium]